MSQTIITAAFEAYLAEQIAAGEVVTLDEFVFAYIDGLDPTIPVDPGEVVPPDEDIVHRQAVDKTGVMNEDAVVYSVTLGTGVGDFSFNWVGLINQASGMLGAVTHIPVQDKYATTEDTQGNILTRSFLMGYAGAKNATQISTPAETWQIDFTARLSGIDERQRKENTDLYGAGAFFDDGFLVSLNAEGAYTLAPGAGYVGGLRVDLTSEMPVVVDTMPVKIWVDAHFAGTAASIWSTHFEIVAAPDLQDYTLDGYQHYVFAVAEIAATGEVTDLRPKGTVDGGQDAHKYVLKSENLADIPDKALARSNLELGTAATHDAEDFLPSSYTPPPAPVTSVNNETGAVQLSAGDVSAYPITGGTLNGPVSAQGEVTSDSNIVAQGYVREGDIRVYSPNNPPPASAGDALSDIALGAQGYAGLGAIGDGEHRDLIAPAGCVLTGLQFYGKGVGSGTTVAQVDGIYYRPEQKCINGVWVTIGHTG